MPLTGLKRTTNECEFFTAVDPYNYLVDNRPLEHLLNNDLILESAVEGVVNEVTAARTGLSAHNTLDERLDAMENSIGASVSVSDVEDIQSFQYINSLSMAEQIRRTCPSGFFDYGGIADIAVGDLYDDFAAVRTTENLGVGYENSVVLWTAWGSYYKPIRANVNGWIVRLFNEKAGSPTTTPLNHVTVGLGSSPASGKYTNFAFLEVWLEQIDKDNPVFYKHGAVDTIDGTPTTDDPLDPNVSYTIKSLALGGDWVQIRHRIRVISDITLTTAEIFNDGFKDTTNVKARGAMPAPVSGYTFANMEEMFDDPGLWRSGAGDNQSKTDLGTFDGYVYAIPMFMIHRRNSGEYTVTNQNGTRIVGDGSSGYLSSGKSGHPANTYYDAVDQRDILDLRTRVSLSGFNLQDELNRTWQMLLRGELRTQWGQLTYDYNDDNVLEGAGIWGHTITVVDQIANSPEALTNTLRDSAVTGNPVAAPDGQRVVWSRNPVVQYVKFSFTQGNNVSASPSGFVTYNSSTETLTFNAATLSGNGTGGTKMGINRPVVVKKSDITSKAKVNSAGGMGTQTATVRLSNLTAAADYVGFVSVVYPGGSGLTFPAKRVLKHEFIDNGTTTYKDESFGVSGVPSTSTLASPHEVVRESGGTYLVADYGNHRICRINPSTWTITAQFGITGTLGSDNTHCNFPTSVCVDGSGNVYFADSQNHRVVKLNSSLVYSTQFGVTGVSGASSTHLNTPKGVATDSTNVYIADSANHRVIYLPTSLASITGQFGTTNKAGSNKEGLNYPISVAVVSSGFGSGVWVSDLNNSRVVVLSSTLTWKFHITDDNSKNTISYKWIKQVVTDEDGNYYILVSDPPDGPVLYKFNSTMSLVAKFGVPGVRKSDNTGLRRPSGVAYSETSQCLYVADTGNHRVVKLNKSLAYVSQYGVTRVTDPGMSRPTSILCPSPSSVDVDSAGNVYIACMSGHIVKKLNSSLVEQAVYGTWSTPGEKGSNARLKNPSGIGVKPDGTSVWVVDQDNDRIVRLNGSLVYQGHFNIVYDTTVNSKVVSNSDNKRGIMGVRYSPYSETINAVSYPNGVWYVTVREKFKGHNTGRSSFAVLKYDEAASVIGTEPQSVRPTSDISLGNWVNGNNQPTRLYKQLADFSDDSYAHGWADGTTYEAKFGPLVDPVVHTDHTLTIISGRFIVGAALDYKLYQGNTLIKAWTHNWDESKLYVTTKTLSSGEAASITNYSDLRLRMTVTGADSAKHGRVTYARFSVPSPGGAATTPNFLERVPITLRYPLTVWTTSSYIIVPSPNNGISLYTRTNPSNVIHTKFKAHTIKFKFYDVGGISSDGSRVYVAEPSTHSIHAFDADFGVYLGSAGVRFESGRDSSHLYSPKHCIVHSDYLVVVDTFNHRILRRHISSPWISKSGTISTMIPPVGADKIRIYYDTEIYQGLLSSLLAENSGANSEAVYRSQVLAESRFLYASTLGLGIPSSTRYTNFLHLDGMTLRLPLPDGWTDYDVAPIGMKTGTASTNDDSPFLVSPVTISEGIMGGQGYYDIGNTGNRQINQQVIRAEAWSADRGRKRGFSTITVPYQTNQFSTGGDARSGPPILGLPSITRTKLNDDAVKKPKATLTVPNVIAVRRFPLVKSVDLLEAIPHFNYFPFLYKRNGRVIMGIVAEGARSTEISVGETAMRYSGNAFDSFWPFGRFMVR